ncbi:MAG: hypothetical protein GX594_00285 [Pirellulaceae bacterium]|nr:hypothetical protein [Pirellulaceae bacterium]
MPVQQFAVSLDGRDHAGQHVVAAEQPPRFRPDACPRTRAQLAQQLAVESGVQSQTFRNSLTALAVRSGAAILPAAIGGAYQAWPRHRTFPRPGRICVHFGPPIPPDEIAALDAQELVAEVECRVRERFARCRQARMS